MKTLDKDILDTKAVKVFIRGLLLIVGLFGGLSYGIVALLLCSGNELDCKIFMFIIILPILPIVVLLVWFLLFSYLPKKKSNESSDDKNKENPFREKTLEMIGNTLSLIAKAIKPDSEKNIEVLQKLLKEMPELFSRMSPEENPKQYLIGDSSNSGSSE